MISMILIASYGKIIASKGKLVLEEESNGNPSIIGSNKVIKSPKENIVGECLECG